MANNNFLIEYYNGKLVSNKKFNILYLNINSLLNKLNDIEILLDGCERDGIVVHFLALTEVRLDDVTSEYFGLHSYNSYFCNKQKNSGGVVVYVHNSIQCSMLTQVSIMNVDLICISVNALNFKICVFYKQPCVPSSTFFAVLESFLDRYHNCILIGDANLDLLKTNSDTTNLLNLALSNSYYILNKIDQSMATRIASRENGTSKTIIDHIYTDITRFDYTFSIHDTPLSDHRMLLLSFNTNSQTMNNPTSFTFNKINFNKFRNLMVNSRLFDPNFIDNNTADACLEEIKALLPLCTSKVTKITPNLAKPWINNDLLETISNRDRYFRLHKKFPFNIFITNRYKALKKEAEKKRTYLKQSFFAHLISKNLNHTRKLWSTFNLIMYNRAKSENTIDCIQGSDGNLLVNNLDKADALNNYFSSIGASLANSLLHSNNNRPRASTLGYSMSNSLVIRKFSTRDIHTTISSLKCTGSSEDNITAKFLKTNIDIFAPLLTKLANDSFESGLFPNSLKIAKLIPLFKAGDATLPKNYRPISILSTISKVFERLLHNTLDSFLSKFNVVNKNQFGFQKNSGTLSACTKLISDLQDSLDKRKYAAAIFIDLQKAFDTVPHVDILDKLYKYGIRGNTFNIFKSYLSERIQYVSLGNCNSSTQHIQYGIPQGSILGPILFLLYINDIFAAPFKGNIQLFADDAVLVFENGSLASLHSDMQSDLNELSNWLYNNLLTVNVDKTKYVIFHSPHRPVESPAAKLLINEKTVERVSEIKYLGLIIQDTLKWNAHINNIIRKSAPLTGVLRRLNRCTPPHLLRAIYFAHIHSRLTYLCPIWGSSTPSYKLNDLQVLQNKAIRNIFNIDYFTNNISTNNIFKKYQILNIPQLIQQNTIMFYYKIQNNLLKIEHDTVQNSDIHGYPTRNMNNIRIPRSTNNYGQFNTFKQGARLFNSLDDSIKCISSLNLFKSKLKKHIIDLS